MGVFMMVYGNYLDFMVKNGDELDYPSLIIEINGQKNNGEKMVLWELMGIKWGFTTVIGGENVI